MINPKFKAVYNPFNRKLAVLYGNEITVYEFSDLEEWTKISYNGDENHPNYLHIQLDYDESLQLLFYPRQDNDESLHEDQGVYFNSNFMNAIPKEIKIVYNDIHWDREYNKLK
jgi:hypothetical protein